MADINRGEHFHHLRRQMFGGDDGYPSAMTTIIFNESGEDINLRVESDTNANALLLDSGTFGGVGQLSIGAAVQATVTSFVVINNPAINTVDNQNFFKLSVDNTAVATVATATTAPIIASVNIDEPNITLTGTGAVTDACSLRIEAAPTEGTRNHAFWVDGGTSRFDGAVTIGATAPATTALLDLTSTTQGALLPRMTTTQRDAITSPATGLSVYNSTTNKLNFFNGTAWEAVTSV